MNGRIEEIETSMNSFTTELYNKSEVLPELLKLQSELVDLTFNGNHAENASLKLWNVVAHLEKLNEECDHPADKELKKFKEDSSIITNTIMAEISGQKGENKAFKSLETLPCKKRILRNVEFTHGDHRTELDMVVITEKAVFIIEVKNTGKDIHIDEQGNYCRKTHGILASDSNIGEKMNEKEYLLRNAFEKAGIKGINIVSLVVFTNSYMQVENNYPYISVCYLSTLPHKICEYTGDLIYTEDMFNKLEFAIEMGRCYEKYPMPVNMKEFKHNFATIIAVLECANTILSEFDDSVDYEELQGTAQGMSSINKRQSIKNWFNKNKKAISYVASFGVIVLGAIAGNTISLHRK